MVKYVKYNRMRQPQFQISTEIHENEGKTFVVKKALTQEAVQHIQSFPQKEKAIKDNYCNLNTVTSKIEGNRAAFPYLEGKSLDGILEGFMGDPELLVAKMQAYLNTIYSFHEGSVKPFEMTSEFAEAFGTVEGLQGDAIEGSNIDAIFENILCVGEELYCIDYEWVFFFSVPVEYLKFRCVYYFYEKYRKYLDSRWTEEEFLELFGIGNFESYLMMEQHFQEYVFGKNRECNYLERYVQERRSFKEMQEAMTSLKQRDEHIQRLDDDLEYGRKEINRLNREIEELGAWGQGLNKEIERLRKKSFSYQLKNIMNYFVEKAFPRSTKRRQYLDYLYMFLHSPLATTKKIFSPKEKITPLVADTVIDLETEYAKHGKITFSQEEEPLVSIIIPVYNQMNYTYSCLVSIKENTKNIPYEIIIADDVSSDETKNMQQYAENIIVSRNETNQGFLRNCNQAAKKARGKYLFFLNNDTQVTENWLEPLVELIESDDSIGMVGSKLVYPDGRLQEAGGIIWNDASGWNYGRLDDPSKPEYNYVRDVDYISGAAILIGTELWNQIGGFDELFVPAYCEDSDLAFQVRQQGYRVVYQPKSVVIHFEGISNGTDLNSGIKSYQVENSKKFREKWKNELEKQFPNAYHPFVARERGFGKKVILVIDHYVPMFDKDAGSKTTFQYLKMFIKKGYTVKFIGDNYFQHEPYTTVLQQMGIEVLYGAWYSKHIFEWIKENEEDIDFVYLNRPHITLKYIDFLKKNTNLKLIYYGHDLHFLRMSREYELTGDKKLKSDLEFWREKEFEIMKKADMSYYPSYIEEEAIHKVDASIPVKAITAYVFEQFREDIEYDFTHKKGILFVGGFNHGPNVDAVLWFAKEVYPKIREKADIPFYIVGSNAPEEITSLNGNGIVVKGFVSEEELCELYLTSKLVIVPLRYGAGVKGKVVEAIYYGAPIITTSVGAEGIPEAASVMEIEDDPDQFANKVVTMYDNHELLTKMAHATQDYIREYYSIDAAWKVIEEDFQN